MTHLLTLALLVTGLTSRYDAGPTVCLITSLGLACAENAAPLGDCVTAGDATICHVEAEAIPIYASWYDPMLGGINCDGTCSHKALQPFHPDQYGQTAACPHDWIAATIDVPATGGSWYCDDRGGAIKLGWRPVWTAQDGHHMVWAWTVDFMLSADQPPPHWAYTLMDWQMAN